MKHGLFDDVRTVCDRAVQKEDLAGLNVLVIREGQELLYYQTGMIDRENGVPVSRDSIFRLYSMTKPVTAAAAYILVERGELSLCEPVGKYLPEWKNTTVYENGEVVPAARPIEIRDLLSMQSGIPYNNPNGNLTERKIDDLMQEMIASTDTDHQMSTRELAGRLADIPMLFQPGQRWQYGLSADVLGAVIEVISGKTLAEFMQDEIFTPLHMKDTGFFVPEEKKNRFTKTYRRTEQGLMEDPTVNLGISFVNQYPPAFHSGGAGLVSTIDDYKRFALMLLNGGRYGDTRILRKQTVDHMRMSQLTPDLPATGWDSLRGYGYGNFMRVCENPGAGYDLAVKEEYGWDGWLGCYFANFPNEKLVILSMQQLCDAGTHAVTRKLRNVILSHLIS